MAWHSAHPPILCPLCPEAVAPEHQTTGKRTVRARNVTPRPFAPAENDDVSEGHDSYADELEDADGEDRVLGEVVRVVHDVDHQRDYPQQHVDAWVYEQEPELALDKPAA